ncbi:MAG: EAL domain-containing protein [Coleofasciculus sp. S288]|nr:EAL domain-containing protein [Coleofasciculus sp. S288]
MNKILVIEDERSIRVNLLKLLSAEGFQVIGADNGSNGVELAKLEQPDVILCDVLMPELDGYGVLKALQQDPVTATIPFIFLTAKADRADWRQAMTLGADDYITKPFTRAELLDAIAIRLQKQVSLTQRHLLELQQAEAQLNHLLHHNHLTNLPNRLLLEERFDKLLSRNKARLDKRPILSLGVEELNQINNALGPASADLLLQAVAERLYNRVGKRDIVAHLGAAQFAILLTTTHHRKEVAKVAETLLDAFSSPFLVGDHEIYLTARVGIAFFGRDGRDLDTLIKHASAAREEAKKPGMRPYQFYIASVGAKSQEALLLEHELRQALERQGELQVYYQPKVNLQTGKIQGAEALVRWYHPERGSISPVEFIPLAEKSGLIVPLGEWILRTACAQAKVWQDGGLSPLRIAVNLSGHQFNQLNLGSLVVEILTETGLDPGYLELELTESTLMQNPDAAIATLRQLKAIGIQVSIDDFGTGYSSLSYLREFPFDILKIDRSFLRCLTDEKNAAIMTAILQMARSLDLRVVAEGVETASQLAFLQAHQCDEIQGYWFSPPLSAETFGELLSAGKRLRKSSL